MAERTITCETRSYRSGTTRGYVCGKPAKRVVMADHARDMRDPENTPARRLVGICGTHIAANRRKYGTPPETFEITDAIRADIIARLTANEAADAETRRVKQAEANARHLKYAAEAWAEYTAEWTSTLVIEERGFRWADEAPGYEVIVRVHPVGAVQPDGRVDDWRSTPVELHEETDKPALVRVRGGSPNSLPPQAAVLVAEAMVLVAGWVAELNAR